jgi:hypothetical protein
MYYIIDLKGEQLQVQDIQTSLQQVNVFLTDAELLSSMDAEEIMYWQDLKEKLLQLQSNETKNNNQ